MPAAEHGVPVANAASVRKPIRFRAGAAVETMLLAIAFRRLLIVRSSLGGKGN